MSWQWQEAPELSSFRVGLEVSDDPDGDDRILESSPGQRLDEVAGEAIAADGTPGESLNVYAPRRLPNPVVADVGRPHQHRANNVGMDVDALVVQDLLGAPANPRAQMAVIGGIWLSHEAIGEFVADEGLCAVVQVLEEDLGRRHAGRDRPVLGVDE